MSALAVGANAAIGLASHARARTVKWRGGAVYAASGVVSALIGSAASKAFDGQRLLFLFAGDGRGRPADAAGTHGGRRRGRRPAPAERAKVTGHGFGTGLFSGFLGIGGDFPSVPGLVALTRMSMLNAVGTSLVAVVAFAFTTALNYARSGPVDWPLAATLVAARML